MKSHHIIRWFYSVMEIWQFQLISHDALNKTYVFVEFKSIRKLVNTEIYCSSNAEI